MVDERRKDVEKNKKKIPTLPALCARRPRYSFPCGTSIIWLRLLRTMVRSLGDRIISPAPALIRARTRMFAQWLTHGSITFDCSYALLEFALFSSRTTQTVKTSQSARADWSFDSCSSSLNWCLFAQLFSGWCWFVYYCKLASSCDTILTKNFSQ